MPADGGDGAVVFDNVAFSYDGQTSGFRDLTLEVNSGDVVAVTGPVGSGKSTIAYLLARFYDVQSGTIYFDGVELNRLSLQSLRKIVGIAFQEPFLFSGTIADNVRYSRPDAERVHVMNAIDTVGLSSYVAALPNGIDTRIGDSGIQLSLGQKRRIDLARAIIKDPRLLILDSVFAEGDADHQREEIEIFERIARRRTTFVINPPSYLAERADKTVRLHRSGMVSVEERERYDTSAPEYSEL
jgi:ATP-binding cassette subfamily B protein